MMEKPKNPNENNRNKILESTGVLLTDQQLYQYNTYRYDANFMNIPDEQVAWIVMTDTQRDNFKDRVERDLIEWGDNEN